MSENTKQSSEQLKTKTEKKSGFFGRIIQRMDDSMKQKADEQAKAGDCCGPDSKGKGGKCC